MSLKIQIKEYQMSCIDLYFMVKEFKDFEGSKVTKIYDEEDQDNRKTLIFQLHKSSHGKQLLKIKCPNYLFLADDKEAADEPSDFVMFLRKKLSGSKMKSIVQLGFERILKIDFENYNFGNYSLYVEFFSKGNIILTENNLILVASEYKKWSDRTIRPRENYKFPGKDKYIIDFSESEFYDKLKESNKEVVKSLASDLGLGGMYSEELCLRANIEKSSRDITNEESRKIYKEFFNLLAEPIRSRVYLENSLVVAISPVPLEKFKDFESQEYGSFSHAIGLFSKVLKIEKKDPKILKIENIIQSQILTIKEMEESSRLEQLKGEYLYENYQKISMIMEHLKTLRKEKTSLKIG